MKPPLVSCICITQHRRLFLRQAVTYFDRARRQFLRETEQRRTVEDWLRSPHDDVELVILDGSQRQDPEDFGSWCAGVRYFHEPSPPHAKTGALHNRACELARGGMIIQWDDDDWQSPNRITEQVRALGGHADDGRPHGAFAFTSQFWWYHLGERRACKARSWAAQDGSAGATFAYHKKAWEAAPFRDVDQGEDNFFWDDHRKLGTPMIDMADPSLVVYIRHNRNGSHAISDAYTDEDTLGARAMLDRDADFYDELSEILPLDEWNNPHARWRAQQALTYGRTTAVGPWAGRRGR